MITVLIVEDSPVARELLNHILGSEPGIKVIGTANNGEEAIEFIKGTKPDVITMDIIMPRMDGYQATRKIMETFPTPIVIVSASLVREEVEKTWLAVEAGAVAVLEKPTYSDMRNRNGNAAKLIETVRAMAQVKLVRRWHKPNQRTVREPAGIAPEARLETQRVKVVAIGASTGGPQVLQDILSRLPKEFRLPILIVQHITPGFAGGFVDWMNSSSSLSVRLAVEGEPLVSGRVYVAPDGHHMKVSQRGRISLSTDEPVNGIRPSVSSLFRSVAEVFGPDAAGVLLTGMGRDGAVELKLMRDRGAVTIAQDIESSAIYGMPGEAAKIGAAKYSLAPKKIAEILLKLAG
jgi:two-component system, chemotaxis family, protein-glutamate methylesterase/glutaminase